MSFVLQEFGRILLLVTALSIDTFTFSFLYGSSKVKIPLLSTVIINAICTTMLAAALILWAVISPLLPPFVTSLISFGILFVLGFSKLFDSSIKAIVKKNQNLFKKICFSYSGLYLVLNIYTDPNSADRDESHDISPKEAVALAVALSLDGLAAGFGAGFTQGNLWLPLLLSFLIGMGAVSMGCRLGHCVAAKTELNVSWLSGLLLLTLAFCKLFA